MVHLAKVGNKMYIQDSIPFFIKWESNPPPSEAAPSQQDHGRDTFIIFILRKP